MTDLEAMLEEWGEWCRRDNKLADDYPGAWCLDEVWLPYKSAPTTEDALDHVMSTRVLNDPMCERVELWVRQLNEEPRAAIRLRYAYMPTVGYTIQHAKALRAILAGYRRAVDEDAWNKWLGEAFADLRFCHEKWLAGV